MMHKMGLDHQTCLSQCHTLLTKNHYQNHYPIGPSSYHKNTPVYFRVLPAQGQSKRERNRVDIPAEETSLTKLMYGDVTDFISHLD